MSESDEAKVQRFLDELTLLSRRYGLVIQGCGCCQSPTIEETSEPPADRRQYWRWNGHHPEGHYIRNDENHQGAELEWMNPKE
jgi:hypothetical protein